MKKPPARDNPETTRPENCRYDTCLVISDNDLTKNEEVASGTVEGGRYLVFKIRHTADAVLKAWLEIFPELSAQGYHFDETIPVLERYAAGMVMNHFCEICVPVK